MRVAIVHDYLNQYGGGERVLEALCGLFPRAPIYTLIYDEKATRGAFKGKEIHTSFLQRIPFTRKYHRIFPLLMPLAVEQFDLSYFDLVISNSASFAKGVITEPHTRHISYCMTPTRFLWAGSHKFIEDTQYIQPVKKLIPLFNSYLRAWDQAAVGRVDRFIANSEHIKKRIKKYYRRDSQVIYPPVKTKKFTIQNAVGDYFLMVGRLVPYKRFDLVVKAFNKLGYPLKIVGEGAEKKNLKRMAGPNIRFTGGISDEEMVKHYSGAKAVIFPQVEDFGIVAVEAMSAGRPVIAYRAGGALETVEDGKTGVFFDEQTEEAVIDAVSRFKPKDFDPTHIRSRSLRFDEDVFKDNFLMAINN